MDRSGADPSLLRHGGLRRGAELVRDILLGTPAHGPAEVSRVGLTRAEARIRRSLFLIHDRRGQPFTLAGLRNDSTGLAWTGKSVICERRPRVIPETSRAAQTLLGHAAATTDGYIRKRTGSLATPIKRRIADKPS